MDNNFRRRVEALISRDILSKEGWAVTAKGWIEAPEEVQQIIADGAILWDTTCEVWDKFCYLWNQCSRIVAQIAGAARTPEEAWDAYKNLKKKKKKKIIKLILYLKGEEIIEEKQIENYEVTISDIELITEMYKTIKEENVEIKVSDITFS